MGQLRKTAQHLSRRVRDGDSVAAAQLLSHSIELGHSRLALHRLFLAHAMGARIEAEQFRYCAALLKSIPKDAAEEIARIQAVNARTYLGRAGKNHVGNA